MTVLSAALVCLVVGVGDGDSLTLRCREGTGRAPLRVRVADIDAPERRQAFGPRAQQHLSQLCLRQRAQVLPVEQDRYGRTVARVRCQGTDVAQAQVAAGLAWAYPHARAPDPALQALQQQAQAARRGLWSQARPQPPWVYRQRHARS